MLKSYKKFNIINYDSLDSTNLEAKRIINELNSYTLITAKTQTNGRGRQGRTWQSLEDNLFTSLIIKNINTTSPSFFYPFITAISICKSIKDSQIKWPNDILLNGKKFAGILIEKYNNNLIIGFGVNIKNSPKDTPYPATSLAEENINITKENLVKNILDNFHLLENEPKENIIRTYLDNLAFIGKHVSINAQNTTISGVIKTIDSNGNLILNSNLKDISINIGEII